MNAHKSLQISETAVNKLIENQSKELEIRKQELDFRDKTEKFDFEYASKALEFKAQDTKDARENNKKMMREKFIFIGFIILIASIVITLLAFLHETELAKELLKAIIYLSAGGIGGYGYAYSRYHKKLHD